MKWLRPAVLSGRIGDNIPGSIQSLSVRERDNAPAL